MQVKDNLVELEVVYSKLNKALDENISRLNAGATAVDNYNKKISVVPSEFQKSLTDIKVKTDAVTISAKKLEQQSIKESNARNALNKQREVTIKQLEREQAKLQASENLYNKVQTKLNALSNEYKNLATKKELGLSLTAKEEQRYASLQTRIQNYDKTLKAVDATMGKHQRNVGNYASGFNPLSNSINQLTREMPAFTYSVQTGFMALSNNIPIFTDAIGNAVRANKELIAQGQPTTSVLKQVAGALFSFQTLMGVGITLLTVYGKEIGEFISGSESKKKAIENEKKAIEEKNKVEEQARENLARYQSDEISRAKILFENAKNLTLSMSERTKAVNELQQRYPEYLGNLSKEKILAGDTADAELKLNDALIKRGIALASQKAIQDEINGNLKNEKWITDQLNAIQEKRLVLGKEINKIDPFTKNEDLRAKYEELNLQLTRLFYLEGTLKEQYNSKNSVIRKSIDFYIKQYNENAKYLNVVREETNETKKNTKAKIEQNKIEETFLLGSIGWYEQKIKLLKEQADVIKENSTVVLAENEAYNKQLAIIADYQLGLEKLLGVKKDLIDNEGIALDLGGSEFITDEDGDRLMEEGDKLRELLKDFKQGFIDDFADQSGFGKFLDILGGGLDKFEGDAVATALAVSDAFQEAFNTIAEMSNANFQNEYNNLEKQKETALLFAGDSASARDEIERQAEEKRRQIAEREFKAQKAQALFNIAVNTAQAVIGALATLPSPSAVPLSIAVGAIGLAQAGIVASREIPQYFTGTDNAKEGFALTQERGREIIMDRFGKIKDLGSDDGARLTKMKAGDKVLNNEKTMELLMFNSQFNSKLAPNLNTMPNLVVNNNTDFSPIIKAIQNKPETILNFDNGEFKKFVRNGNSIKETTQIRNGFKGLRV